MSWSTKEELPTPSSHCSDCIRFVGDDRRFRDSNFPSCTFCFRQGFERAKLLQSTNLIRRSSAECRWKRLQSRLRHGMSHENKVLRSWKEIAAYLGKGVRTVQRWEQLLGLPIKRQKAKAMGTVVASTDELDRWLLTGWAQRAIETNEKLRPSIDDYRRLRQTNRELTHGLALAVQRLKDKSEELARAASPGKTASTPTQKPIRFASRKRS